MPTEVVAIAPRQAVFREYEEPPVIPPNAVRVRTEFGSVKHGTELRMYRGISPFSDSRYNEAFHAFVSDQPGASFPMGLGNMCVGVVVEVGKDVRHVRVGDRVAGYGALRETHLWSEEQVRILPVNMTWKEAVCYDPAQFALSGLRDGHVRIGDRVAVFGLGAIGLLAVQLARIAGAVFVAAVDPIARRREVALRHGADLALDPGDTDAGLEIKKATLNKGVDVAVETSGDYSALHHALRSVAWGGAVSVVGWYKECKGGLDLGREAHFNLPDIIMSRACSEPNRDHPRWDIGRIRDVCWDLLAKNAVNCEEIVDPVVPFSSVIEAFHDVDRAPEKSIKLGVVFGK
ncbi:MAG: zinc-binding alcohol dehydrogenase [Bacillota bacterium]